MKILRELLQLAENQVQNNVLDYFDKKEIQQYAYQRDKSRDKLIMMNIEDFLKVALPGSSDIKRERVSNMIRQNEQFTLPYLDIEYQGKTAKVIGHEGRHRGRELHKLGYKQMPVILKSDKIRWSEQTDANLFDYLKEWPEILISQGGKRNIPFPVSRTNSDKGFPYK